MGFAAVPAVVPVVVLVVVLVVGGSDMAFSCCKAPGVPRPDVRPTNSASANGFPPCRPHRPCMFARQQCHPGDAGRKWPVVPPIFDTVGDTAGEVGQPGPSLINMLVRRASRPGKGGVGRTFPVNGQSTPTSPAASRAGSRAPSTALPSPGNVQGSKRCFGAWKPRQEGDLLVNRDAALSLTGLPPAEQC